MRPADNPFAASRIDRTVSYRLLESTWDGLLSRFQELGHQAAIVGPKGHGKSTLLDSFVTYLTERGFTIHRFKLSADDKQLNWRRVREAATEPHVLIILDGAEQLSMLGWQRFKRLAKPASGVLITTHNEGRLPTLLECRTTPELLQQIGESLLLHAPVSIDIDWQSLHNRHRGDLRQAFRELYDRCSIL